MLDKIKKNEQVKINDDTIKILNRNFPSCFTNEGKFDLLKFKELLADKIDCTQEGYSLNFLGKNYAKYLTALDEDTLLVPDEEHNCKLENEKSKNIYISGDNFESMKHLLNSYRGMIKAIYLDPPYNTGSDGFTYRDRFNFTVDSLIERMNLNKKETKRLLDLTTRDSASHSAWLMFMLPRLLMARDLLLPEGVVMISIDENEHANLKLLCDDVFDERNFAGEIIWKNSSKNDQDYISMQHEYILFYVKDKDKNKGEWKEKKGGLEEIYKAFEGFRKKTDNPEEIHKMALDWFKQFPPSNPIYDSKHYTWFDDIKGVYYPDNIAGPNSGQYVYDVIHPETGEVVKAPSSGWRYPKEALLQRIKEGKIQFGKDHTTIPKNKTYLVDTEYQSLTSIKYKDGRVASKLIETLLGGKYFSNPKDVDLMSSLFKAIGVHDGDIVLDCFSGSATTAHSVMKINSENSGDIRYIHLQIQEEIKEKDAAYKAGYRTIDQVGQARIKAAAQLIKKETGAKIDYGYKHFSIKQLKDNTIDKMEEFDANIMVVENNILDDLGESTILSTWLCRDGYGLCSKAKEVDLNGYKASYYGKHLYLINKGFRKNNVEALIKRYIEDINFNPEHIVLFGYSFENWTTCEVLKRNLEVLKVSQKDLKINYDIRY